MGSSKAWLPWGGRTLLEHVVSLLPPTVEPVVVVRGAGQDIPPLPTSTRIAEDRVCDQGPLRGLLTGLEQLRDERPAAFVTTCDAPFLQAEFVTYLRSRLGNHEAVVVRDSAGWHPLAAVYRTELAGTLDRWLAAGHRRAQDWLEAIDTLAVSPDELVDADPDFQSLRNLNSPGEYQHALDEHLRSRGDFLSEPRP